MTRGIPTDPELERSIPSGPPHAVEAPRAICGATVYARTVLELGSDWPVTRYKILVLGTAS